LSGNRLPATLALVLAFVSSNAFGEDGLVDQSVDALFNLHDQLQDVVTKSVKGVGEAMQEGPPPETDRPFTLEDLQKIQQKNAQLYNLNKALAQQQQKLLTLNAQILNKLPPNDPRRGALVTQTKQIGDGLTGTREQQKHFGQKVAEANAAIHGWSQKNDPTYVPPKETTAVPAATAAPAEPPNTEPPKTDNGLDNLKAREAAKEAEARALGREREAAINKYIDDPTPENRAEAEAIKQRLVGLVDDLNRVRHQVDGIDGRSRPGIRIRTAAQIAEHHRKNRGSSGGGTESHHHGPNGTDVSSSESHHHGPGGGGRRTRRNKPAIVSSESHHHGPGGVDVPGKQSAPQKKNRAQRMRQAKAR